MTTQEMVAPHRCAACGTVTELSGEDFRLCRRITYGYFPSRFRPAPKMDFLPVLCNGVMVQVEERRSEREANEQC